MQEMESIVYLYAGSNTSWAFNKIFNNKDALELDISWALSVKDAKAVVLSCCRDDKRFFEERCSSDVKLRILDDITDLSILKDMVDCAAEYKVDTVIYTKADKPFLDVSLTEKLLEYHEKYMAEYTFADGYPVGFAPEVINAGTLNILTEFALKKEVYDSFIFDLISKDINSYEVETYIAPKDYRYLRLDFSCSTKSKYLSCVNLYNAAVKKSIDFNVSSLSDLSEKDSDIQCTVPAFYNVQICSSYNSKGIYNPYLEDSSLKDMDYDLFCNFLHQSEMLSKSAVVSLSAWGEPLLHKDFIPFVKAVCDIKDFFVLIETDGTLVTEELVKNICDVCGENAKKIIWIVYLDAYTELMYKKIRKDGDYQRAKDSIPLLVKYFGSNVYPQFTRMNDNEEELESFYRFYHEKSSPSKGNVIIQKYDNFCGLLPDKKPADLSPVHRYPCWHLKRDMVILCNGDVPYCKDQMDKNIIGNVFDLGVAEVWFKQRAMVIEHIRENYNDKCRNCDECYTFNF